MFTLSALPVLMNTGSAGAEVFYGMILSDCIELDSEVAEIASRGYVNRSLRTLESLAVV